MLSRIIQVGNSVFLVGLGATEVLLDQTRRTSLGGFIPRAALPSGEK